VSDPASDPVPSSVAFLAWQTTCADGHHAWATYIASVGRCWTTLGSAPPLPLPTYPPKHIDLCSSKYRGIRASRAIGDLSTVVSDALEEGSMGGIECSEEVIPEEDFS